MRHFSFKTLYVPALGLIGLIFMVATAGCGSDVPGQEWEFRTDMRRQPSIRSQEAPRAAVPGTVPISGDTPSGGLEHDAVTLQNPFAPEAASLDQGKRLFEIYCTPCHGVIGKGDGPVAAKFSEPPDLTQEKYRRVSDGYIYSVIRNGFLTMPPYYEMTTPSERWHIVNYLRSLQRP